MPATESLGLFPLRTVLLPGASLGLRVFEPRYLDLVSECGRNGRGFGVCLIIKGDEVGEPATAAAFGTEAIIEDFGSTEESVLTLRVRGARRFRVKNVRVRDNGLQVGEVSWCEDEGSEPIRPEHGLLPLVLQQLLDHVDGAYAASAQLDDAAWVGWRLAELLPLSLTQRQELLQLDDPHQRLQQLLRLFSD